MIMFEHESQHLDLVCSTAGEIAMAGGDLIMPGSRADYDKVLAKIRESKENRLQAEQNAERLIRLVRTLKQ